MMAEKFVLQKKSPASSASETVKDNVSRQILAISHSKYKMKVRCEF